MNNFSELITNTIHQREVKYFLVTEEDINIASTSIWDEAFWTLSLFCLAQALAIFITKNISLNIPESTIKVMNLLIILLLILGVFLFAMGISSKIRAQKKRTSIFQSGAIKSFSTGNAESKLEIITAEYGADKTWKDIKAQLNHLIKNNKLSEKASNDIAGDPVPNVVKILKLKYKYGNKTFEKEYNENDIINLP